MELDTGTDNAAFEGADVVLDDAQDDKTFTGDGWAEKAVAALEEKRANEARQRPRAEDEDEADPNVTRVVWKDPAKADKAISTKDAAKEYSAYRQELASQILQGAQSDWDAQAAQEAQAAEPEAIQQAQEQTAEQQWNTYVEGLTPEGRAQLSAAVEYQQKAQHTEQAALVYETALVDLVGRLTGSGTWNDIRTVEDAQRLQVQDPNRFAQLQQHVATVQQVQAEALKVHQQRQAQQQAQFQEGYRAYATQQDREAEKLIPELSANADPESQRRLMRGTIENLREVGFSDRELQAAWVQGAPLYLRDARAQKIIADAARWRMANSREARNDLRAKRAHTAGPVQRPGVSRSTYENNNERALSEKLAKQGDIHTAVQLLQARRASRR